MTFEEFVEALYRIGWRAIGDAQHTQIRHLWNELVERGLIVHRGGSTTVPADENKAGHPCPHGYDVFEYCPVEGCIRHRR